MKNLAMGRKLNTGEAIDVEAIAAPFTDMDRADPLLAGTWRIDPARYVDERDYCVASSESWIWSIGKRQDGAIFAALDTRFYQNPRFTCLWLR